MQTIDIVVEGAVSNTMRARQVSSMFDAPPEKKCRLEWRIAMDLDEAPWNVGLVVGPSGSGKSTIMRHVWGEPEPLTWDGPGVVDDFAKEQSVGDIAAICSAVGFNTIPAWLRPYSVLSNGEKFRVELARRLLETEGTVVFDEFTSVVDRQVAQIGSHAVQKYVRKNGRQFVAVTCHYDVLEWLQPDWVLDVATRQFTRRRLQRRPELHCTVGRVPRAAWSLFAPYHYMSASLHRSAECYGLWVGGKLAAFLGLLHRPQSAGDNSPVWGVSRLITLPDYQGLGLAFALVDAVSAANAIAGARTRTYPAHPALVIAFDRSKNWALIKRPGRMSNSNLSGTISSKMGGRPCAVFEYCGPSSTEGRQLGIVRGRASKAPAAPLPARETPAA